jgi:hypothetical protein
MRRILARFNAEAIGSQLSAISSIAINHPEPEYRSGDINGACDGICAHLRDLRAVCDGAMELTAES